MTRITVLLAVHDGAQYLPEALDGILAQTYADFELLAVDDASTDATPRILAACAARDLRVRILTNPANLGLTRSLNIGLRAARGAYIARHDADDRSAPDRLARQAAALDADAGVALVVSDARLIDAAGGVTGAWVHRQAAPALMRWLLLFYNAVGLHSAVMFRRDAALALGGYDESLRYAQDYDLWVRLAAGGDVHIIRAPLIDLRLHPGTISAQRQAEQTALAHGIAARAQADLLGTDPAAAVVAAAWGFWAGLPTDPAALPALDSHLWRLYHAFCAREPSAAAAIRRITAAQYLAAEGGRPYAWRWSPGLMLAGLAGRVRRSIARRVRRNL